MQNSRFFNILIAILLCIPCSDSFAYDFETDGIYYNIVSKKKKQVEVTHWEEETTIDGVPHRHHHAPCSCCQHDVCDTEHLAEAFMLDSLAIIREKNAYIGDVCVPEFVQYKHRKYVVIGVGDGAFFKRKQLKKVELPESIQYVGRESFDGCKNLQEIVLPNNLKHIGLGAFRHCANLTSLVLPDSIQSIDAYAFAFCINLTTIRWPLKVTQMPGNVFWNCTRLQTIEMPQMLPPTITKDGLTMNFKDITFLIMPEAFSAFQADANWQTKKLKVKE